VKLRPHHILCVQFLPDGDTGRGREYKEMETRIKEVMRQPDDTLIEVTKGVDDLCAPCPDCADGRCNNRFGDEASVRKWDARVIGGLGISFGESMSAKALHTLIRSKAPLAFCRDRCPWRPACGVFGKIGG
jgi:hypothetical protein